MFVNHRPFIHAGRMLHGDDRVLSASSGRTKYSRRQGEVKTVEHWGQVRSLVLSIGAAVANTPGPRQRKLMLSEIEFLVHYGEPGTVVVYAGAAPGT